MTTRFGAARRLFGKRLVVVGVGTVLGLIAMVGCSPEEPAQFSTLSIDNDEAVAAGESFYVTVTGARPGERVDLSVDAGYGPRTFSSRSEGDTASFEVPPSMVAESGVAMLQATASSSSGWSQIIVTPVEAVDPLDLYLGPRTVVADAEHFSMIVAVPTDRFGNPVRPGTAVDFTHYTPTDAVDQIRVSTANLLAFTEVYAGTTAGRSRLATEVGPASGEQRTFEEVAGAAIPFTIEPVGPVPVADGESLLRIETSELVDKFDNQLPDGVAVMLTIEEEQTTRRLSSVTIDGVASFTLEAPKRPVEVTAQAESGGTIGEELRLTFPPAVATFDVEALTLSREREPVTELQIGPVLTVDEFYIPDGTEIEVTVDGQTYEGVSDEGVSSVVVDAVEGDAVVTILGHSESVELGR